MDEVSSLADSTPQKILFVGDDSIDFQQKLLFLKRNHAERYNKLWGVCARLQFVEHLLNSASFMVIDHIEPMATYQAERTAAYLTATCIDVIAGKSFKKYLNWLMDKTKGQAENVFGRSCKLPLSTIDEAETFITEISASLYDEYENESSIGRNFRRLIMGNYDWLTNWLIKSYIIEKGDIFLKLVDVDNCSWVKLSSERKIRQIAEYIYNLRNRFTHTVDSHPSLERGGIVSIPIFGEKYTFNSFYEDGNLNKPIEMSVGLTAGYAESDVIRLIVTVELRKWLGFEDKEQFLEKYWRATRNRKAIYATVRELKENYELIFEWHALHLLRHFNTDGHFPIRKLKDRATNDLVNETGKTAHYMLEPYIQTVWQVNKLIDEIKHEWPREKQRLVNKLLQANEIEPLVYYIREIYYGLLQRVDFASHSLG